MSPLCIFLIPWMCKILIRFPIHEREKDWSSFISNVLSKIKCKTNKKVEMMNECEHFMSWSQNETVWVVWGGVWLVLSLYLFTSTLHFLWRYNFFVLESYNVSLTNNWPLLKKMSLILDKQTQNMEVENLGKACNNIWMTLSFFTTSKH
jgi:hypothetical protein